MLWCWAVSRKGATPPDEPGLPPTRRQTGGSRREASDRIRVAVADREIDGWALNVSRGGIRVILDEALEPGARVRLAVGDQPFRDGRVVWVQAEPDGAIVGFEFLDPEGRPVHQSVPQLRAVHPPPVKKPTSE